MNLFLHSGTLYGTLKEMPKKPTPHSNGEYDTIEMYDYEGQLEKFLREHCLRIIESDWEEVIELIGKAERRRIEQSLTEEEADFAAD